MATFDSAYLLSWFNRKAGRPEPPEGSDAITDASKYQRLTESQNRVIAQMMAVAPQSLYPKVSYANMPTLTTTDQQVFTFGTDANGYPISPMGKTWVGPSLSGLLDSPWVEGSDYYNEGTQIRIPDNRSFAGTLYWYGIPNPPDITATTQPSIFPEAARELIVMDAVRQFATEYIRNPALASAMKAEWDLAWPTWCLAWKTNFRQGGAYSAWTGRDMALNSYYNYVI